MKSEQILAICGAAGADQQPLLLSFLDAKAKLEDASIQRRLLKRLLTRHAQLAVRVDSLLRNTLPSSVADEITYRGSFTPAEYDCSILFSDFESFTTLAEDLRPVTLVGILHRIFSRFDDITAAWSGTKVKTMGDAYMAVFGAPERYDGHAGKAVRAGLQMVSAVHEFNLKTSVDLRMRVGVHTGKVVAGVVGKQRMQFDVFGDDVNIASRFESSGSAGRVNVSENTYRETLDQFRFEERGLVPFKNKGLMRAYFVSGELPEAPDENT